MHPPSPPIFRREIAPENEAEFMDSPLGERAQLIYPASVQGGHQFTNRLWASWRIYSLSNGGFYLAPRTFKGDVEVRGRSFSCTLSADAFGLCVTLFAMFATMVELEEASATWQLIDLDSDRVRDYVRINPEKANIWRLLTG